jgi:hypothetical protein
VLSVLRCSESLFFCEDSRPRVHRRPRPRSRGAVIFYRGTDAFLRLHPESARADTPAQKIDDEDDDDSVVGLRRELSRTLHRAKFSVVNPI